MEQEMFSKDQYSLTISAPVNGQVAVGRGIHQEYRATPVEPPSVENLEDLRKALEELRKQVLASAPPDTQAKALEKVDELAVAVTTPKPDLTTMEYVRNWFVRNLPKLAGAVTGVIIHPLVGQLVSAGGDVLVSEFKHRFGLE